MQPDGSRLTIASLIRPGWVLRMPGDASALASRRSRAAAAQARKARTRGAGAEARRRTGQDRQRVRDEAVSTADGGAATGVGSAARRKCDGGTRHGGDSSQQSCGAAGLMSSSAASLLAAGVLAALGRRRRERLWQRGFGRRLVAPDGDAAVAEAALRLGADDPAVQLLDTSLRQLSAALARGKTPPTVFAAHLGGEHLDLWIAPADPNRRRRGSRSTAGRYGGCRSPPPRRSTPAARSRPTRAW